MGESSLIENMLWQAQWRVEVSLGHFPLWKKGDKYFKGDEEGDHVCMISVGKTGKLLFECMVFTWDFFRLFVMWCKSMPLSYLNFLSKFYIAHSCFCVYNYTYIASYLVFFDCISTDWIIVCLWVNFLSERVNE